MSETVLYGATGYTGRLVAAELKRTGAEFALAGRSIEKLRSVAADLQIDVPLHAVSVYDGPGLRELLSEARCVVNCAGPFAEIGGNVIEAAIDTGTHYIDTTGEQLYMKSVFDSYANRASEANVAVVCAMGFDFVPADMGVHLATAGLGHLDELVVAYSLTNVAASHGSMLTAMQVMSSGSVVYENRAFHKAPRMPRRRRVRFPAPLGEQACVSFPGGEVICVPRHIDVDNLVVMISTSSMVPSRMLGKPLPWLIPVVSLALKTPLQAALGRLVRRLPEGPTEAQLRAMTFTVAIEARGAAGSRSAVVSDGDTYGFTATSCAHAAALLVDPSYDRSGVLAPAEAFDPQSFLDYLGNYGLRVELGSA